MANGRTRTSISVDEETIEEIKRFAELNNETVSSISEAAMKMLLQENKGELEADEKKPCVIAVTNYKGGVAKTTTTLNLSIELARLGHKVLMIDMDGQGNLSQNVGVYDEDESFKTVAEVMMEMKRGEERATLAEVIQHTPYANVDIVPADIRLADADTGIMQSLQGAYDSRLRAPLEDFLESDDNPGYGYVLIDCPPALNIISHNAINALYAGNVKSMVIIPVKVDGLVIRGMQRTISMVRSVADAQRLKPRPCYFLHTVAERNTTAYKEGSKQLREEFPKASFLSTVIPKSTAVPEGTLALYPVVEYAPESPASIAYANLAYEIEEMVGHE